MKRVFIGFDSGQAIAYDVLAYSLRKHAREELDIRPIKLKEMEERGFQRPHDPLQSTEFTYTRFLVPWLCDYEGVALFLDCDMLALGDICEVFDLDMSDYALRVVRHDHKPADGIKMGKLGRPQSAYPRKNWSSMMLMRCDKLRFWTKEAVETWPGAWLHRFGGIPDAFIGDISREEWNVLDRHDERTKLIHYTSGGVWLPGCENHPYGDIWLNYKKCMKLERGEA